MARRRLREKTLGRLTAAKSPSSADDYLHDLNLRINDGMVIPIINNSVRNDRIFDIDYNYNVGLNKDRVEDPHVEALNVDEELAEIWADYIGYPMPDRTNLARVAIFSRIKSDDAAQAKTKYLNFLKSCLLNLAQDDEEVSDLVEELTRQSATLLFSDIACELDYPRFPQGREDPLRLLARLPLPIYVTTSYYDFLERALQEEGRPSQTEICFLSGLPQHIAPEHRPRPDFVPTPEKPLVYHLYGYEKYPDSLILSEDDYLDFLVKIAQDTDQFSPIIPPYLREALATSSLILLGYRLHDWDFRVLFRGLINAEQNYLRDRRFSLAIQLDPVEQKEIANEAEAQLYLQDYFEASMFKVEWGNTERFVEKLWQNWDKWRRGER